MSRGCFLRRVLPALAILSLTASNDPAKSVFPLPVYEMKMAPVAIRLLDLNGDGHRDMVTVGAVSGGTGILSIRLGDDEGGFGPASDFVVGGSPLFVASADLNQDGCPDLVVANGGSNDVSVFLGDGQGSMGPETRFATGTSYSTQSLAIGDLNEDGHLDLVAPVYYRDVSILLGNGDGSFGSPAIFSAGTWPRAPVLRDLDGDGHLDLVMADKYTDEVSVRMGRGNGTFGHATTFSTSEEPVNLFLEDINSDTVPDLIADAKYEVAIHLGSGGGRFDDPTTVPAEGSLALGQFAGDASPDLLLLNGSEVDVYPGAGDGTFLPALATPLEFDGAAGGMETGDVDGDGTPDLATGFGYSTSVVVLPGKGNGTFETLHQIPMGAVSLAAGDFDGDQVPDLVAAPSTVYFLKGYGNGTFGAPVPIPSSGASSYIIAGDLNGDGKPDLVSVSDSAGQVSAFLGNGAGGFTLAGSFPVGAFPQKAALGDFDGDGNKDLAVTNASDDVSVLLGHGDGTFGPETRLPAGVIPSGVGVADFDLDGAQDIAAANWNPDAISLYFGNGDGTFQPETQLPSSLTRHVPLLVADFNGDGKEDFAVGGQPWCFEVFLSHGDGTFEPPRLYRTPWGWVADLAVGDFNGDGIPDLVSADDSNSTITLFAGAGDGHFVKDVSALANSFSEVVVSADFNLDGADDLAVTGEGTGKLTILLSQAASAGPCQDADGDGFGMPGDLSCPAGALPDCDDSDAGISPVAVDPCDGADQNCDGLDGTDLDGDGYTPCTGDCDETRVNFHPGATEYCNGFDDDCDGGVDVPGEVAKDLTFAAAGDAFSWSAAPPSTSAYNVYRGPLGPGAFAPDQACFVSAITTPQATDTDPIPVPDQGYYYLVSGSNSCGEGTLGFLSDAQERPNLLPCP